MELSFILLTVDELDLQLESFGWDLWQLYAIATTSQIYVSRYLTDQDCTEVYGVELVLGDTQMNEWMFDESEAKSEQCGRYTGGQHGIGETKLL